jgi:hypothetical protein
VAAPGDARPASVGRRLERLLANNRLDPDSVWSQLARAVLGGWTGGPVVLILDETPNHNDLRCMKITLAYRKRALPLCCACYGLGEQPEPMPELIPRLIRPAHTPARPGSSVGTAGPARSSTTARATWSSAARIIQAGRPASTVDRASPSSPPTAASSRSVCRVRACRRSRYTTALGSSSPPPPSR